MQARGSRMAENISQQLVRDYLTIFEHLAVTPQFPVVFDDKDEPCFEESQARVSWKLYPDFLAVDLKRCQAQIVEVKKSPDRGVPDELVKRVLASREKAEQYVRWFTACCTFDVQWRLFVCESN